MLQTGGKTYELFRFVPGVRDDGSVEAAGEAGAALGLLHALLKEFEPAWKPPSGNFHGAPAITRRLGEISGRLGDPRLRAPAHALTVAYQEAGRQAQAGVAASPTQLIHADWHPGNMLFARTPSGVGPILAVVDYDSVRLGPRVLDAASGGLQFSFVRSAARAKSARTSGTRDTQRSPITLNDSRYTAFFRGYHRFAQPALAPTELTALPWLMVEALVGEAAVAAGGSGKASGRVAPGSVPALLRFVEKKVAWMMENASRLAAMAAPSG
jgi:Ser/Thr protein kinase RdoA (MazF antagonist)